MSGRSIKAGVKTLLLETLPPLEGGGQRQILERYPRTIDNSKGDVIVLWMRRGKEERFAGSGRNNGGAMQGVKRLYWDCRIDVIKWGQDIEGDYDAFEDLVDEIMSICRRNNTLGGYQAPDGTQVLNFGEWMDLESFEPQYARQFLRYQSSIHVTVEEIYNA